MAQKMKIQRFAYMPPADPKKPHCVLCGEQENITLDYAGYFKSCNECGNDDNNPCRCGIPGCLHGELCGIPPRREAG